MKQKRHEIWREDSPRGFLTKAKDFRDVGSDALAVHKGRHGRRNPVQYITLTFPASLPIYYLFLHSIELSLKTYLLQVKAVTIGQLRKQYGHDISKLSAIAVQHNLESRCKIDRKQWEAVYQVAGYYLEKRFEYFQLGLLTMPPIEPIAQIADNLIEGIDKMELRIAKAPDQG